MRSPNRPDLNSIAEHLCELAPDEIAQVALIAVQVAYELGLDGSGWNAYHILEAAPLTPEAKSALWSLFDSRQRGAIKECAKLKADYEKRKDTTGTR